MVLLLSLVIFKKIDLENLDDSFIISVICIVLIFSLWLYRSQKNEYIAKLKAQFASPKKHNKVDSILEQYFPYFQNLDKTLKTRFLRRIKTFLELKLFIPRQTTKSEKVNVLIAAAATQLTFGLDKFNLFTFKKILIYPDAYYSEIRKQYHKGEINVQARLIVLSAKHFLEGIRDESDGINLGLHELAHALNVNEFEDGNDEFIYYFKQWEEEARKEIVKIKQNSNHFLRKYATTNIQEMFAVSTEYFFERPNEFSVQLPILYKKMCQVYKQNPIDTKNPLLSL